MFLYMTSRNGTPLAPNLVGLNDAHGLNDASARKLLWLRVDGFNAARGLHNAPMAVYTVLQKYLLGTGSGAKAVELSFRVSPYDPCLHYVSNIT